MFNRNEINNADAKPTRKHHRWEDLEEYHPYGGMWATPPLADREAWVDATRDLMANPGAFEAAMIRAIAEWPKSCEAALTTPGLNRRAWIGHAGCYLATGSPEETTRLGWHALTADQQYEANAAADRAITAWLTAETGEREPTLFDGGENA